MIFDLVQYFAVSTVVATKVVNAIETADTVVTVIALLGTLVTTAGLGTAAIGAAMALFKSTAKKVGKKAAKKIVIAW